MILDECSGTADVFTTDFGSLQEMWGPQPPPGPAYLSEDYLSLDSTSAFLSQFDASTLDPNWDCSWVFTLPADTENEVGFGITVTGPGAFAANDMLTLDVTIFHTPQ